MSETPTPEATEEAPANTEDTAATTTTEQEDNTPDWKSEAEKWKALSRKNERALKELQAQAAKEAPEDIDALKAELETYRAEIAKQQKRETVKNIVKLYELPAEAETLLKGDDEEELENHAKALQQLLGTAKPKAPSIPTQGLSNQEPPKKELSAEEELQQWLAARKK